MILALFDLQVTLMLPTKIQVNCLSVQKKKLKIEFKDRDHLGFPMGIVLAISDLKVTPMLPTKFQVKQPFGSGEEALNRYSRWRQWRPS